MDVCTEGSACVLNVGDTKQELERNFCFVRAVKGKVRLGKYHCEVSPLVGAPWGSFFQLRDNALHGPLTKQAAYNIDKDALVALAGGSGENNKTIYGEGMKVQSTDVNNLKEEGAGGAEILEKLVENSATFAQRTKFSQEKFMNQKQRKHAPVVELIRPSARALCETAFLKAPQKTIGMRVDGLAQILQLSAVTSGSQVLVIDGTSGLISGAVAERMAGNGLLLAGTVSQWQPEQGIFQWFNLPKPHEDVITWFHATPMIEPPAPAPARAEENPARPPAVPLSELTEEQLAEREKRLAEKQVAYERREASREAKRLETLSLEAKLDSGMDSLIVCLSCGPMEAFWAMLPKLRFGCPFVIYCDFMEPLSEGLHQLKMKHCAVRLHLQETWFREYQVLPERTHPVMSTSATCGYILSGVYIDASSTRNNQEAVKLQASKKRKVEDNAAAAEEPDAKKECGDNA